VVSNGQGWVDSWEFMDTLVANNISDRKATALKYANLSASIIAAFADQQIIPRCVLY
jgi:hypothetical protein